MFKYLTVSLFVMPVFKKDRTSVSFLILLKTENSTHTIDILMKTLSLDETKQIIRNVVFVSDMELQI